MVNWLEALCSWLVTYTDCYHRQHELGAFMRHPHPSEKDGRYSTNQWQHLKQHLMFDDGPKANVEDKNNWKWPIWEGKSRQFCNYFSWILFVHISLTTTLEHCFLDDPWRPRKPGCSWGENVKLMQGKCFMSNQLNFQWKQSNKSLSLQLVSPIPPPTSFSRQSLWTCASNPSVGPGLELSLLEVKAGQNF